MDCPNCGRSMKPRATKEYTKGWTCEKCGYFPVVCNCGIINGQEHDVLCLRK